MTNKIIFFLFLFSIMVASVWAAASSEDYYLAGNKLYTQGNYDLCIKYYKAAIQVDAQNWKAYQALGSCEYHIGNKESAISYFNQSLYINPNNAGLRNFVNRISGGSAVPSSVVAMKRENALPQQDSVTWNIMIAADIGSYDDFTSFYGSTLNTNSLVPIGVEFGLGGDYTISPQFQIGFNLEGIYRHTDPVSIVSNQGLYNEQVSNQTWTELCYGPAVDMKYLIPINANYTFIIRGEVGYYLTGSSIAITASNAYATATATYNLSSSNIGELIGVEVEWMRGPGWALDVGLSYRALTFTPITYTYTNSYGVSGNGTLVNNKNVNAFMDFSGLNLTTAIRFF